MRLDDVEESSNVEDRRGMGPGKMVAGGGIGTIVIVLIVMALGGDPQQLLNQSQPGGGLGQSPEGSAPINDEGSRFVKKILGQTEKVWGKLFSEAGKTYPEPKLVMFSGQVQSGCGPAGAEVGPFYCPADKQVYIDISFYDTMKEQLGAPGDFAQAYVIAHEIGHHIQNVLGVSQQVERARRQLSETEFNKLSVKMELQADYYAGVWAHHAEDIGIDKQDIKEAMNAANAIGDDTLQRRSQGHVVPEAFTHGTSQQRMRWFMRGFERGSLTGGDTFNARQL